MNSMILPGSNLGDFTVVAAGSVVNKPFLDGHCVIAGSPAKVIRKLEPAECVAYRYQHEYYGFLSAIEFAAFRNKFLKVWK